MPINPETIRSPRNEPPVDAPIYLSHEAHRTVFDPIRQLHREVAAVSLPDAFNTQINGVALEGQPPAHLGDLAGYRNLGFSALKKYGEDAKVDIVLVGRDPRDHLNFSSSPHHVDFAHNKIFTVREGTDSTPSNHMSFDDLAYLLGDYIPVSTFTDLSDPRSGASFDEAAVAMSDSLEALDTKRRGLSFTDRRTFCSSEERFHGDNLDFVTQRHARLLSSSTKEVGKGIVKKLAVEISAPLAVHDHAVNTILRYELNVPTDRRQPLKATTRLELRSSTAARSDLEWALRSKQEDIEPVHLIQEAIAMIRRDHTDKR